MVDGVPPSPGQQAAEVLAPITAPAAKAPTKAAAAVKKAATRVAKPAKEIVPFAAVPEEEDEFVNVMYCGPHGSGKTSHLASLANLGPTIFVNSEAGLKSKPLRALGINVDNLQLWPNREKGERLSFEGMEELFWRIRGQLVDKPGSIAGICWDSFTDIHKILLEDVVTAAAKKADAAGRDRERFFTEVGGYGTMTEQVRFLMRRFRDLECHWGMSALLRRDIDKAGGGGVIYRPAVTPALINDLGLFTDMMCYTSVGEIGEEAEYRGQFRPDPMREAKDRFGVIHCKQLVDPTFERVVAYVQGRLTGDEDVVMAEARALRAAIRAGEIQGELAAGGAT